MGYIYIYKDWEKLVFHIKKPWKETGIYIYITPSKYYWGKKNNQDINPSDRC